MKSPTDIESLLGQGIENVPRFDDLAGDAFYRRMQPKLVPRKSKISWSNSLLVAMVVVLSGFVMHLMAIQLSYIAVALVLNVCVVFLLGWMVRWVC